jgi:hypothetical protein
MNTVNQSSLSLQKTIMEEDRRAIACFRSLELNIARCLSAYPLQLEEDHLGE